MEVVNLESPNRNKHLRDFDSVLVIGIAGGSGSGKTTFARLLGAHLGEGFCGILRQDSYYLDQSGLFDHDGGRVNYDHPESIEFSLMIEHLNQLKAGHDLKVPQYDFVTHKRLSTHEPFPCRPVIIVDGILILTQPALRDVLDVSIFVDTAEDLRFQRRLYRDTRERGRTAEGVKEQFFSQVKPMHDLFVEPSRDFAQRVISGEKSFGPEIEKLVYGLENRSLNI